MRVAVVVILAVAGGACDGGGGAAGGIGEGMGFFSGAAVIWGFGTDQVERLGVETALLGEVSLDLGEGKYGVGNVRFALVVVSAHCGL